MINPIFVLICAVMASTEHPSGRYTFQYLSYIDFYNSENKQVPLKIQDFLSSLPQSVIKGEEVSVPDNVVRKMLTIANVNEKDIFYDLGYGNSNTVTIAAKEFKVKRSVGIDIRKPIPLSHKRIPK